MEIWRDVPDYEGMYQVSDDGRVRRLWQLTPEAHAKGLRKPRGFMKPGKNNQGRLQVTLSKHSQTQRFLLHRLVLLAFTGACPDGYEGRHRDRDYTNCQVNNLFWSPCNSRATSAAGTVPIGQAAGRSKLTEEQVRDIRASNDSERALATRYGVSSVAIHFIKTRKTWKHV